jgi:hypothetical protein
MVFYRPFALLIRDAEYAEDLILILFVERAKRIELTPSEQILPN